MLKKRFIKNSLLMMSALLITQIASIFFNTYISFRIGAEGMGIYRLVITVYVFSATFATSGITLAVTRIVTDFLAFKRYGEVKFTVAVCMAVGVGLSCVVGILLFTFSGKIGVDFLGDARTVLSLKVLSFSLPFMAVSACFRGYFLAVRSVIKSASEQLFEQIVQILVCVSIITPFCEKGLEYACCAVAVGTTLSEAASCIYSAVLYFIDISKYKTKIGRFDGILRRLSAIGLPVMGSSCLRSGLSMIENTLIPTGLQRYGFSPEKALGEYGIIMGMAMPVLMFPIVFLAPISSLIIPEMSEAKASNRTLGISRMAKKILTATGLFIIPITLIFLIFGDDIAFLLYKRDDVGVYIKILALTIPFSYLDCVVDGMLKGLNQQIYYFTYNMIDSTVRVMLAFLLIPRIGVKGVIVIMFVSVILNSTLSTHRLISVVSKKN